jgi:hypothetical protein
MIGKNGRPVEAETELPRLAKMIHTRDRGSGAGALLCHIFGKSRCVKWILDGCIMHAWHMASREHIRLHIILLYYLLHASVYVHLPMPGPKGGA